MSASGQLTEVIKFLKTQGDVTSISNPKVLTLNNQPALITAGTEYFYKITSSTNQQGTGGGVAATTQNDQVNSVFAGVLLTITPEISDDKTITLKINPSLSETTTDISQTPNSGRDMTPDLNRRQLSSVVTVKDGNRIILGGLINSKNTSNSNQVPILGSIPVLGYLFKHEEMVKTVEELVIIIEPHIIHKEKNSISLSDLGYEGLSDDLVTLESSAKEKKEIKLNPKDNEEKKGK
jgi:general secretion pathway protein D